jgi:hypothetical protein
LKNLSSKLKVNCVGGGRIQHDANERKIKVYGFSQVKELFHNLSYASTYFPILIFCSKNNFAEHLFIREKKSSSVTFKGLKKIPISQYNFINIDFFCALFPN